jgi:transcriptional regulator with XRE-family HTH domain
MNEKLRMLRKERGITQRQLDRAARFAHGYTSKLEMGRVKNPGIRQLQKIADALGVPVERLLGDSNRINEAPVESEQEQNNRIATDPVILEIYHNVRAIGRVDPNRLAVLRVVVSDMKKQVTQEQGGRL